MEKKKFKTINFKYHVTIEPPATHYSFPSNSKSTNDLMFDLGNGETVQYLTTGVATHQKIVNGKIFVESNYPIRKLEDGNYEIYFE